jgi:hypothetical protein
MCRTAPQPTVCPCSPTTECCRLATLVMSTVWGACIDLSRPCRADARTRCDQNGGKSCVSCGGCTSCRLSRCRSGSGQVCRRASGTGGCVPRCRVPVRPVHRCRRRGTRRRWCVTVDGRDRSVTRSVTRSEKSCSFQCSLHSWQEEPQSLHGQQVHERCHVDIRARRRPRGKPSSAGADMVSVVATSIAVNMVSPAGSFAGLSSTSLVSTVLVSPLLVGAELATGVDVVSFLLYAEPDV